MAWNNPTAPLHPGVPPPSAYGYQGPVPPPAAPPPGFIHQPQPPGAMAPPYPVAGGPVVWDMPSYQDYGGVQGFDDFVLLPPPPSAPPLPDERKPQNYNQLPNVTAEDCRDAIMNFVSENCCYGKKPARDHEIRDVHFSTALHYCLETFTESRGTKWKQEPYKGQSLDGPEFGMPPPPWGIYCQPDQQFQDHIKYIDIPHTATVKSCTLCSGHGFRRCLPCNGSGRVRCNPCLGKGYREHTPGPHHDVHEHDHEAHEHDHDVHGHHHGRRGRHGHRRRGHGRHHHHEGRGHGPHMDKQSCASCQGMGTSRCFTCNETGRENCKTCKGHARLKCFLQLEVKFLNHREDHVLESNDVPSELIQKVRGQVLFEQQQTQVWPMTGFPVPEVAQRSTQVVNSHLTKFPQERVLQQRQTLRGISVTKVTAEWKSWRSHYWVYGDERKVYCPDYPQKCCGCTLL